jgi:hypothetical protein
MLLHFTGLKCVLASWVESFVCADTDRMLAKKTKVKSSCLNMYEGFELEI